MNTMSSKIRMLAVSAVLLCMNAVEAKPLKVFILAGQSNMEGHAKTSTFPAVAKDQKTAELYKK